TRPRCGWHHDRSYRHSAGAMPRWPLNRLAAGPDMSTLTTAKEQPSSTRAERVGWYSYDLGISAFRATVVTVFLGPYLGSVASRPADAGGLVHPFGIPVAAGSLFAYTVSVSVLLTVLILPLVGAIADRIYYKKQLLGLFAYLGAAATIGLVGLTGTR